MKSKIVLTLCALSSLSMQGGIPMCKRQIRPKGPAHAAHHVLPEFDTPSFASPIAHNTPAHQHHINHIATPLQAASNPNQTPFPSPVSPTNLNSAFIIFEDGSNTPPQSSSKDVNPKALKPIKLFK